ncbi:hypothetical protein NQ315_014388 [Exocentrus adspersus]|uniref:Uncharacterized protein n=1 Tax=Exocentrus adspersus TaxID=1586481 RepID=A0AAV8VF76_9CUCU|nr:hypothetical protein NQ315_014388 [Exocentrus adspersus]
MVVMVMVMMVMMLKMVMMVMMGQEPVSWVRDAINQVIAKGTEGLSPEDQVAFSFCSKDYKEGDGWVPFRPVIEVTYDNVWKVISSIYQSNSTGLNTETFCLGVTSVKMLAGRGTGPNYNTYDEECSKQHGIVCIKNKDNMFFPRVFDRYSWETCWTPMVIAAVEFKNLFPAYTMLVPHCFSSHTNHWMAIFDWLQHHPQPPGMIPIVFDYRKLRRKTLLQQLAMGAGFGKVADTTSFQHLWAEFQTGSG